MEWGDFVDRCGQDLYVLVRCGEHHQGGTHAPHF